MNIEEPKKLVTGIFFTFFFPLFGIFLFSKLEFMNINLYEDIFLPMGSNFVNSMFEWFFALFKTEIISTPSMNSVINTIPPILTWFTTGYVTGVIIKRLKVVFLLSLIIPIIHFIILMIFGALNNSMTDMFAINLSVFLGGLITSFGSITLGSYLGTLAGK